MGRSDGFEVHTVRKGQLLQRELGGANGTRLGSGKVGSGDARQGRGLDLCWGLASSADCQTQLCERRLTGGSQGRVLRGRWFRVNPTKSLFETRLTRKENGARMMVRAPTTPAYHEPARSVE